MGYIKVKYRRLLQYMDYYCDLPDRWKEFIDEQKIKQNLVIKGNGKCTCTNCNYSFETTKKVNEVVKCPYCKNIYLIKRSNLRFLTFKDYISVLEKVNDTFVIRYFELRSTYNYKTGFTRSVKEFGRELAFEYDEVFVNNRVSKCQGTIYISHLNNPGAWRQYTRHYKLVCGSIIYPHNIKELLKDSPYKYSMIWELVKHREYIDFRKLLYDITNYPQIEFLTKLKLYNLAFEARDFSRTGSFNKIFGVPKSFYSFMKRHNISKDQLELLQLLNEADIKKIRYLEKYSFYDLKEISKYISLNRFLKYAKSKHSNVKTYLYKDYLRFANYLGFDLKNNKYAFPKDLRKEHDKLEKQYEINNQELINNAIIKRCNLLKKKTYHDKNFIIFPAASIEDLNDESNQQNHCVRDYAERYAEGECDIYFMRDIKNKKKSLVTVEVINDTVVQSRIKNNYDPSQQQQKFLNLWEQNVLKGAA